MTVLYLYFVLYLQVARLIILITYCEFVASLLLAVYTHIPSVSVSVSSTRDKLQVLQKHYEALGRMSEDSDLMVNGKRKLKLKKVHVCVAVYCVMMSI